MTDKIIIKGAREHNLKNINVEIPKNKLIVFTGVSGSGKSSLAFDTIYAEGQRRYVESLSSYARQFLGVMDKPDCDLIEGLSPAISIDQKTTSHNPRSTVGTVTEIYDYLRLLYARIGHPHCPQCGKEIAPLTIDLIVEQIKKLSPRQRLLILAPVVKGRRGEYTKLFQNLVKDGYKRVRIDKEIFSLDEDLVLLKNNKHDIEVVIDRIVFNKNETARLRDGVEAALRIADGELIISFVGDASFEFPEKPKMMEDHLFSQKFACQVCNISLPEMEPRMFSFNTPYGACPYCTGLGYLLKIDRDLILNPDLTISEGGILPLGKEIDHETYFMKQIKELCFQNNIRTDLALKNINKDKLNVVLDAVCARLERIYKETLSDWSRMNIERYMRNETCQICRGSRLKPEALGVTIGNLSIVDMTALPIRQALAWVNKIEETPVSHPIKKELISRLGFLVDVGLDYLSLNRSANTLAGGEAQRIRLASQIGSGLSGVLYVLDEPSIGLHQRDNIKLIETLKRLRDLGNTVIVVEHDREMMEHADYIYDFGPGAGINGGKIVAQGTVEQIKKDKNSITGDYLSGRKHISGDVIMPLQDDILQQKLVVFGCSEHNLKNITVEFPLGKLIGVTGVSGSGKSTLVNDILYHALAQKFYPQHKEKPGKFSETSGWELLDKVVMIDQSPIGRTPRSNPATYTGLFSFVRQLFAQTSEARLRGFKEGKFSFNVKGGRCEACEGEGQKKIEMQFLPDIYVTCEVCRGKRYEAAVLEVEYKDKNIAQVLNMTVDDALQFFASIPALHRKLETLQDVGLGYIRLGQPAPTLSGGEAQRVKLATELSKKATGKTIYILDEPTTGLHFADLRRLLYVLKRLVAVGNTVVVIEHNLDIIKNCDHLIDLGPEGGDGGGQIVATGTPNEVAANTQSYTGKYLRDIL
jgi:excinuclease ABC subunit A